MINLSKAAAFEIKRLQLLRQKPESRLRLGVKTGGCVELYYTIDLDEVVNPGDLVFECGDISVVVDAFSLNYIPDLMLDYSEDLMGGGFRFHNPKTAKSCGCGNSFSVET